MLHTKPTWVLVIIALVGFAASFIGQLFFDIEALTWTEVTGLMLWFIGTLLFVGAILAIFQNRKSSKHE